MHPSVTVDPQHGVEAGIDRARQYPFLADSAPLPVKNEGFLSNVGESVHVETDVPRINKCIEEIVSTVSRVLRPARREPKLSEIALSKPGHAPPSKTQDAQTGYQEHRRAPRIRNARHVR